MDIQQIVAQFAKSAAEDPSQLKQLGIDPAAAIKNATGLDLTDEEVEDAVAALEPLTQGKGLDLGKVTELVGDFLGDGDVLGKLGGLFGGK